MKDIRKFSIDMRSIMCCAILLIMICISSCGESGGTSTNSSDHVDPSLLNTITSFSINDELVTNPPTMFTLTLPYNTDTKLVNVCINVDGGTITATSKNLVQALGCNKVGYFAGATQTRSVSVVYKVTAQDSIQTRSYTVQLVLAPAPVNKYFVGYLDANGFAGLRSAPDYTKYNAVIFGFGYTDSADTNPTIVTSAGFVQSFNPTAIKLLSIGGMFYTVDTYKIGGTKIANNVIAQIKAYAALGITIDGVDLDIENYDPVLDDTYLSQVIFDIANTIKKYNVTNGTKYLVAIAPQPVALPADGSAYIDVNTPTNLLFSAGGTHNTYMKAVNNNVIDFILLQNYNTGCGSINFGSLLEGKDIKCALGTSIDETAPQFISKMAQALNNLVDSASTCKQNTQTLCIPDTNKIILGLPANMPGAYQVAMFNPNQIDNRFMDGKLFEENKNKFVSQKLILDELKNAVNASLEFKHFDGIMFWSINSDVNCWNPWNRWIYPEPYCVPLAFTNTISPLLIMKH